jgi:hypothetical protein
MPKKAHLENHLRAEELKGKYRTSRNPVEARRWHLKRENCVRMDD